MMTKLDHVYALQQLVPLSSDELGQVDGGSLKEWFIAIVGPWGASLFGITVGSSAAEEIGP